MSVEALLDAGAVLPAVEVLRPASCPGCGEPAYLPGRPLGIVGHGTYTRQVLGIASAVRDVLVRVRRFLCRGCRRTTSVLADVLHPGRWYAATVILEALRLHLVEGRSEREIRRRFAPHVDAEGWRSLRRWRRQILSPLWRWWARPLGAAGPASTRAEGRGRLVRLLAHGALGAAGVSDAGVSDAGVSDAGVSAAVASRLGARTVHDRGRSWPLGHALPDSVVARPRRE